MSRKRETKFSKELRNILEFLKKDQVPDALVAQRAGCSLSYLRQLARGSSRPSKFAAEQIQKALASYGVDLEVDTRGLKGGKSPSWGRPWSETHRKSMEKAGRVKAGSRAKKKKKAVNLCCAAPTLALRHEVATRLMQSHLSFEDLRILEDIINRLETKG